MTVVHWDDVDGETSEIGHLGGAWRDLGSAAGSVHVGLSRITVPAGKWTTPAHAECGEEEIFFVLAGSGVSWQDGRCHDVAAGDCLVHHVEGAAHTLCAGPDGLDVLAFGQRAPVGGTYLPRVGVVRHGPVAVPTSGDRHPWELEADAGAPALTASLPRPETIVALDSVDGVERTNGGDVRLTQRDLGRAGGSVRTGLRHVTVAPGKLGAPPHCHSLEEEIFVVLEGDGVAAIGEEELPVAPGSVVARPAGTGVAHAFRAGDGGLVYLAYGTREPNDIAFYPRSGKVSFRGVKLIARVEALDYWDGEP
jgi:uncharacterized cupin superfamily protein